METLIQKISSYELFNNLLPGVVFCFFTKNLINISMDLNNNIVEILFLYYFIGIVVGRVGSVFVKPVLKKVKFIYLW